ncbi:Sodium/hydrogen exchanger family-domain-containing protein [Crassisporium funariophilum]|nr:Sodium/hydrogen exchanger family-domain-containing protein [Crassisporium funariophilum]
MEYGSVSYDIPSLPLLLTISAFLYLLNLADFLFSHLINAGLLGPLFIGIAFGPQGANILPTFIQETFILLGYIGLLLLVFEAGLTTDFGLLVKNLGLSVVVGLTGVALPVALSLLLLHVGYGYSLLQAFAAGAALCSTSLGTTLALLSVEWRKTRVGAVLLSAALLDDVVGLVIAAIIQNLSFSSGISWLTIVRPILVSLAFGLLTPLSAYLLHRASLKLPSSWMHRIYSTDIQLFLIVSILSAFVAGSKYAGTSEIFGAYLAGTFLALIFKHGTASPPSGAATPSGISYDLNDVNTPNPSIESSAIIPVLPPMLAFTTHLNPILLTLLSPIFFSSIGTALPIRSLFSVNGSHKVIWRGIVYSLLMIVAKVAVGLWMLVWPDLRTGKAWFALKGTSLDHKDLIPKFPEQQTLPLNMNPQGQERIELGSTRTDSQSTPYMGFPIPSEPSPMQAAALLGLAMVARGEIALIVAQLARPILMGDVDEGGQSEPFAVVIWAILLSTVGGALGVGALLRSWK